MSTASHVGGGTGLNIHARPGRLALVFALAIGAVLVLGGWLLWLNRHVTYGNDVFLWALFGTTAGAYTVSGVAIVRRVPTHVIGWLCLGTGGVLELGLTLTQYGIFAVRTDPRSLPAPGLALVLAETTPLLTLTGIILIAHLFPTGRPVARRWWLFVAASIAGQAVAIIRTLLVPHRVIDVWSDELSHAGASALDPLGIPAFHRIGGALNAIAAVLVMAGTVGAIASLFVRRRRGTVEERQQIRWVAAVAGAAAGWIVLMLPIMVLTDPNGPAGAVFWLVATPLVALGPPAAIGIGIVKYRLFDIDVVIRKTVVVTVVAITLTGLYLAVLTLATVGRVSRLLVGLALLAVTFGPVRRAARTIAGRVAYGRRASAYEVLSDFSTRMSEAYATDDVLPRIARILMQGTGASAAGVWLRLGGRLQVVTEAGEPTWSHAPIRIDAETLPPLGAEAAEVRHQGELLGALGVSLPPSDPLDPARRRLLQDMASQAGLVLRNVRLIEELRASRQRLVAAQDEERRRLERNIHDGVQQQLVALEVKLRLADQLVERDAAKARELLDQLRTQTRTTLEDLRDLARGIYPPLLADQGLVAALESQGRRSPVPLELSSDGVGRYPKEIESAVYFTVLEALNNVAKYAGASRALVRLAASDERLEFEVTDDGRGFDPAATTFGTGLQGITDRLDAIGGRLDVRSSPGRGTTLRGVVPVTQVPPEADDPDSA